MDATRDPAAPMLLHRGFRDASRGLSLAARYRISPPWMRVLYAALSLIAAQLVGCGLLPDSSATRHQSNDRRAVCHAAAAAFLASTGGAAFAEGIPKALDPSGWTPDRTQKTAYDPRRALLYDTRAGSFLPASPQRLIGPALQRGITIEAAMGSGVELAPRAAPRVLFAAEDHTNPMHQVPSCSNPARACRRHGHGMRAR